ncbi:disease resistance protein RPM1-like isoform X1 [Camellia sinensis]|uniref:disease resistance protein RPM1-like isoform X1 n=1 Tax=Camellia sinensis TaxID=4442 RepID=UPI0010361D71|nr:disease resistance protein RPM1-like isoform X1 [Camellia sinensis]
MAMIAVKVVLEKLGSLLAEEAQFLGGVGNGVAELRDDLESMRSFLQDAEARSESDKGVQTWVKQVRDVSYDTEDILEEFLLRLSPPQGSGFFHSLRKVYHHLQQLRARHRLVVQVEDLKMKVKAVSERRNTFSFKREEEATTSTTTLQLQPRNDPRLASLFLDEADVVGIENPKSVLISWLVSGKQNLTAVSVVGMGGVGKTTLVKKVYDSQVVKKYFNCHAWITVSQSFTTAELLRAALKDFLEETQEPIPEGLDTMGEIQLINKLRDYLQQKRYVVVFDDVWSINAWESVKFALPDYCCGSRIIFTTRIGDVAAAIETAGHVYHLHPLPEEEAWTLFCNKTFRGENRGVCPKELEEMSYSILKKCGGLPLAIVAIGSLLSKKHKHLLEWKKVHDSLSAEVKSNSSLENLKRILMLSYIDLPYHLKCCFLYLSVFPEDYLIKRMKLIRLWVVERFVEEKPGLTAEEVAEDYLNELVSRSMIQVVQKDYFNRVRTCRLHDVMREIIQLKSRDESFVMILLNDRRMSQDEKIRRMSIHASCEEELPSTIRLTSLRSLWVFVSKGSSISFGKTFFKDFKLLGVLELERAPLYEFPSELTKTIHLRYLSLRMTMIRELPESIGKLKKLEILDLKHCPISSLPNGILKLEHLCQLRGYGYRSESSTMFASTYGMSVPTKIGGLTNLQKLGSVEVNGNGDMVREFGKLTQLRRLGILKLTQEDGVNLCSSLEKLKHLTSLYLVSISTIEPLHLDSLSSCPQFLQCLYLKSSLLTLPKWIISLKYLAKLVLQYSNLDDDPLKSLQGLPNLVVLELREAYAGEELCCNVGGYPRLKKLGLKQLRQLKSIRVEQGAMPGLRALHIASCKKLEMVPLGVEHLKNLQHLLVWLMPRGFCQKIERPHGEDFWKVQHITTIEAFH